MTLSQSDAPIAAPPIAHVVLYQPEIPQNTGNIGRSCVAVGAKLWIVEPAAFDLSEKRVRRAGLDYWKHLEIECVPSWPNVANQVPRERTFFFSRFAERTVWDVEFQIGDMFVFGSESSGLPREIVGPDNPHALRLPTSDRVRSLNLATTVGIILFEQQRQLCGARNKDPLE
ncbi:MAG: tRNA (cytidine(34)-2'-O)-methyltransferase [Planctomycetota bacterium]